MLWPATGFTKGDLVDYYRAVAPALIPHVRGRPLMLGRFPDGIGKPGFLQTECRGAPDWMPTVELQLRAGNVRRYCTVDDEASLVWIANLGTIELHPYVDDHAIVFDLDPGEGGGLTETARLALALRDRFRSAVVKTSGGLGLHVYAPAQELSRQQIVATARLHARELSTDVVRIDWKQNHERRSLVAPYSLRATPEPRVSAPVAWAEVEELAASGDPRPLRFTPADVLARIERHGDLFAEAIPKGRD